MKTVALIPVRGGSKSIPLKNIKIINKRPLVFWTIKAACECESIDEVYVATDSEMIKNVVNEIKNYLIVGRDKLRVVDRGAETSTDTASTESVMLEFASQHEFENIVLIQATSPLLTSTDLDNGFAKYYEKDIDSVLSVVRQKRFIWREETGSFATSVNYDYMKRPRRQDFDGYLVENGAFYINSKNNLLETKNRLSGNIGVVEMEEDTFFEIDEPSDWDIVENLMKRRCEKQSIPNIKILLTDCDGCLTDAGMYYSEKGDELKKFNTKDGMGFKLLSEAGIKTGIITGENVELNQRRVDKLKLDYYEKGCTNKLEVIKKICETNSVTLEEVCYIGDDINDLEAIQKVGFGCCPHDAVNVIKENASYVTEAKGGYGVIREVVELILNEKNK